MFPSLQFLLTPLSLSYHFDMIVRGVHDPKAGRVVSNKVIVWFWGYVFFDFDFDFFCS